MKNPASDLDAREEQLDQIVASFLESVESGARPDRRAIIETHPDLAAELAAFFADHDRLKTLADPLRQLALAVDEALVAPPEGSRFGEFDLLREIARGGMGVVYEARQRGLNRRVALKLVLSGRFAAPDDLRRFQVEAEAAAQLDHPNIVPILDVGEEQGLPYLSMKLLEGGSLAERLDRFRDDPRAAARLVATIARAVHHAHQRGILHRDLKPSNILFDAEDQPHVADFGLAKRLDAGDDATRSGAMLGSPPYMAPEQVSGTKHATTTATDVHGLGAILHALLTGSPPFQAATLAELVVLVRDRDPEPPSARNRRVDLDLQTICLKCLEKAPARRYGSALAVAEELERRLEGRPIQARPAGRVERIARWARRNPLVAGLLAMSGWLLLALAASLVVGFVRIAHEQKRTADQRDLANARARTLEHELYISRINRAQMEQAAANISLAEADLDACPPALRGWEWRYLKHLSHRDLLTFREHRHPIRALAFLPDGNGMLSVAIPHDPREPELAGLRLWDARTGLASVAKGLRGLAAAALHASRGLAALVDLDGNFTVIDTRSGETIHAYNLRRNGLQEWINSVAFSPDGTRIVGAGRTRAQGHVYLWEPATGGRIRSFPESSAVFQARFSPDGSQVASAMMDGAVVLWDVEAGTEVRRLRGHSQQVFCVAYSPDGTRIASGGWDKRVRLWDVASGAPLRTYLGHTSIVRAVAFSPDGSRIASAGEDGVVRLWDAEADTEIASFRGHAGFVVALAFDPEGTRIASGSTDATVKLWDLESDPDVRPLRHQGWVNCVAFSPDGKHVVSGSADATVKLWDAATGCEISTLTGDHYPVSGLAWSPDGRWIASASHGAELRIWDYRAGAIEASRHFLVHQSLVHSVAYSPDGRRLATASQDGTVKIWDPATGRALRTFDGHDGWVVSVRFSPDGAWIASAGVDNTVKIWDPATGVVRSTLRCENHSSGATLKARMLAWSPDGFRLAACEGTGPTAPGVVRVWDTATERTVLVLRGHTDHVNSVAFSPDGSRIASAGNDKTVILWDAHTGDQVLTLRGHGGGVIGLDFSPDGQRLATGSIDHTVKLWDAPRP